MTPTSQNVPLVLAQLCRTAVKAVRAYAVPKAGLTDDEAADLAGALGTLEALPEQIEQLRAETSE